MRWTEEQYQAIMQEGSNIIVSAGAGSGKTAVLSERVLRKVNDGVDIRNILILTFTNEAAGEMKNRIRKKLQKALLVEQLEYIDSAYITTFDAYALSIVKKYHYLLNIGNSISIIDSSIIELEKERILEEIFLDLYDKKDSDFLKLVGDFTNRDDTSIKEAILSINRTLDLKYDKKEYLNTYLENFYSDEYINQLFEEYFLYLKDLADFIQNDVYALESMMDEKAYIKVYDAYSVFFSPKNYEDLYKIKDIPKVQFRGLDGDAESIKETLKKNISEIMELTKYSEEELKKQLVSTKSYVKIIIDIILRLDKQLSNYKKKNESFEFVDIAKMAIQIVKENKSICEELKYSYNEILIDEYQDTNDLQEMFISTIENNNVYMVGDIKQSIYRFRNANPNIFKTKYDLYAKHINGEKIDLLKNFRSRREVLDNINEIFNFIMTEEIGGVNYHENHAMIYGNMAYIEAGENGYDNNMDILKYHNEDKKFSNTEIEAFTIAHDIKEKLESHYQVYDFDLGTKRDILYKDFCIILDRGSDMPLYKKIFEYLGIPMDVYKDSDLVRSNDLLIIKNIIHLIMKIKNKEYDTSMRYYFVSIARSFIGNMNDAEIFKYISDNTFYDSDIYKICFDLAKNIELKTPNMLLKEIIDAFHFYEKIIRVGNVKDSIMRIDYLLDIALSAESLGFTIPDFGKYLEDMVNDQKEIRYKETRGVGNCVKIMNIHKSKGLEFPICYFGGFKKDFNLRDLQSRFMCDSKYGILTPFYQDGVGTVFTKTLIKNNYYKEEISEKIRLFYVALTRAKEKMIMVVPEFERIVKQKGEVDRLEALKYRSFYDFMQSISGNLMRFMKSIDLNGLGLTKDYDKKLRNKTLDTSNEFRKIEFIENCIESKIIDNKHASKTIHNILNKEEASTLEYGTMMHEKLEMTNFKDLSIHNKYIDNLRNHFDFINATIYQELEFIFNDEDTEYHGIIDLMLEYDDKIKIIDYKLKNVEDENYIKQLEVYYKYISRVSDKKIELYLYSILDNQVKEIFYL